MGNVHAFGSLLTTANFNLGFQTRTPTSNKDLVPSLVHFQICFSNCLARMIFKVGSYFQNLNRLFQDVQANIFNTFSTYFQIDFQIYFQNTRQNAKGEIETVIVVIVVILIAVVIIIIIIIMIIIIIVVVLV